MPTYFEDYVHTVHPDTGLDVVFVPGEAMPAWYVEEQAAAPAPVVEPAAGNRPVTVQEADQAPVDVA